MIDPRTLYITEDAYVGPPREVSADELNATIDRRQRMTDEEKRKLSQAAWNDIGQNGIRFKPHGNH